MNSDSHTNPPDTQSDAAHSHAAKPSNGKWIGLFLAVLLIACAAAYLFTNRALTPPVVATSSFDDVLTFVTNPHGFAAMPFDQQDKYFTDIRSKCHDETAHRAMKSYLDEADEAEINRLRDVLEPFVFNLVAHKAERYSRLSKEEKLQFLLDFDDSVNADRDWLFGHGDPTRNLSARLGKLVPSSPEALLERYNKNLSPAQRTHVEAMMADLKKPHVQEILRERERTRGQ